MCTKKDDVEKIVDIIRDAGGKLVGRTRLQKTACLLELAGQGEGFHFDYHHYGPYSEELAHAAVLASAMNRIHEEEHRAEWGGRYSVYTSSEHNAPSASEPVRGALIHKAATANAITLELATTAAYLAHEGEDDPWGETARRKPDKAEDGRLENAKQLYQELRGIAPGLPVI